MVSQRVVAVVGGAVVMVVASFAIGALYAGRLDAASAASYDARLAALRDEMTRALERDTSHRQVGTAGHEDVATSPRGRALDSRDAVVTDRAALVAEIKEQLRHEMGLLPVSLLRERRSSFVELHAYDDVGEKTYGTAGYLGDGYFVTVKHAVIALPDSATAQNGRRIVSLKVVYRGREVTARVIDAGAATTEVDRGDWAIIRTRLLDLPALAVDTAFPYEFAEPIFRLGNDYSKGIVASTGYVGQRTDAGLVTCLTDGHPGVSGGGVLDQRGALVGIPIGRMQGDYRFSFILPIRREMLRKVPSVAHVAEVAAAATH